MRCLLFLAPLLLACAGAAQLVAPLTTSDGKIACLQGITGVGRAARWEAVKDPAALGGWALSETGGDATDLHFPLCISDADHRARRRRHPALQGDRRHPRPGGRPDRARPERQRLLRGARRCARRHPSGSTEWSAAGGP